MSNKLNTISFYIDHASGESTRYRVLNIIEALLKRGIKCNLINPFSQALDKKVEESDLIIFFRASYNEMFERLVKKASFLNIPCVYDIDDMIIDETALEYIDLYKTLNQYQKAFYLNDMKNHIKAFNCCDYFTGSTHYLSDIAKQKGKKTFVIPNSINYSQYNLAMELINNQKDNSKIKISYFSGSPTHQKDFEQAQASVIKALDENKSIELHVVGHIKLDEDFEKYESQIVKAPMMNHLEMLEYLSKMDINLAPLEITPFNHSKSELKIFEAALVKVPTIASPTDSYNRCINDEINAFLAVNQQEWSSKLSILINDKHLRKTMAESARQHFIKEFYIDEIVEDIIKIYEEIIKDSPRKVFMLKKNATENNYREICEEYNIKYSEDDIDNLNITPLFYLPKQALPDFFIKATLTSPKIQEKINSFALKNPKKRVCLYGGGIYLNKILEFTDLSKINIVGIIDKSESKWGTKAGDYSVYGPNDLKGLNPDFLITTLLHSASALEDIIDLLKEQNVAPFIIDNLFYY
jgi:glycosyltransferase involved in cell wall biosynthesis